MAILIWIKCFQSHLPSPTAVSCLNSPPSNWNIKCLIRANVSAFIQLIFPSHPLLSTFSMSLPVSAYEHNSPRPIIIVGYIFSTSSLETISPVCHWQYRTPYSSYNHQKAYYFVLHSSLIRCVFVQVVRPTHVRGLDRVFVQR